MSLVGTWELWCDMWKVGLSMEVWGGARWKGECRYRHKQVVGNDGNVRVLGLSLD